jgi:predicted Zn-dependent protease
LFCAETLTAREAEHRVSFSVSLTVRKKDFRPQRKEVYDGREKSDYDKIPSIMTAGRNAIRR